MKVGIVTFHRALNYGAILQAYALQQYLLSLGIDSDIIDYRSSYIERFYKPIKANPFTQPKMFARELLYAPFNYKKRRKFEQFIENFVKTSKTVKSEKELKMLNGEYDYFIAGSDQIWNLKWNGFDKTFFLNFTKNNKKFSYAASFGFETIPEGSEKEYKNLLCDFESISVRENTGRRIVKELIGCDATVSIDPTCLLEREKWEKISVKPEEQGYVLLYTLEKSSELITYAKKIAQKLKTKIVCISDALKKSSEFEYQGFLSPTEFVGLFANAGYVVTNSFHGLMFSVIFEKQFCLQYQQAKGAPNSRLIDFIHDFKLENRVLKGNAIEEKDINYKIVKQLISLKRDEAKMYLTALRGDMIEEKIVLPVSKNKCCGCRACEQICPKGAISMKDDNEGFIYPEIDEKQCIKCGKCLQVCVFSKNKLPENPQKPMRAVVCYHKDTEKRMRSRSGGMFVAISDQMLENSGIIYGTKFQDDFKVKHGRAIDEHERDAFCGSKYVQSDTGQTYRNVLEDLKNEKHVLYSGTACQIAGLKQYLREKGIVFPNNHLVTVDIICHGVMSPLLWRENLNEIEKKIKGKVDSVQFRDKRFGWESHIETYTSNKETIRGERYTAVFYCHNGLRPSCYCCPYASIERVADITLGDAWGIKKIYPEWETSKGISLVLVNTEAGEVVLEKAQKELVIKNIELNQMMQPNLLGPTKRPKDRNKFWKDFQQKGYSYIANKCVKKENRLKHKNEMKAKIVKFLRKCRLK